MNSPTEPGDVPSSPGATRHHPVGSGLGALGGGLAGAAAGAAFGPIGLLVGASLGAAAGGLGGHHLADHLDPATEADYWRAAHRERPYFDSKYGFETDYLPAYRFGVERHGEADPPQWDDSLESVLHEEWLHRRANSALTWQQARPVVRDAWDRAERSRRAHASADRFHERRFASRQADGDAREASDGQDALRFGDYRPAYRYGTWARSAHAGREWDEALEHDLERGWQRVKGTSRLSWARAREAVREAWDAAQHAVPGDDAVDGDGR